MVRHLDELEEFVRSRSIDRVVAALRSQVPDAPIDTVIDAVQEAMIATARRDADGPIDDIAGYLFTAAKHALVRQLRRDRVIVSTPPSELPDHPDRSPGVADQVADRIDTARLLELIRSLVAQWESERRRTVIEIYLDAIERGVDVTAADVAEIAASSTGVELSTANVYKLKNRGFAQLARQLDHMVAGQSVTSEGDTT